MFSFPLDNTTRWRGISGKTILELFLAGKMEIGRVLKAIGTGQVKANVVKREAWKLVRAQTDFKAQLALVKRIHPLLHLKAA